MQQHIICKLITVVQFKLTRYSQVCLTVSYLPVVSIEFHLQSYSIAYHARPSLNRQSQHSPIFRDYSLVSISNSHPNGKWQSLQCEYNSRPTNQRNCNSINVNQASFCCNFITGIYASTVVLGHANTASLPAPKQCGSWQHTVRLT